MSSLPVEATEPDPAATSIPNDETVNKEQADPSAPTAMDIVAEDKQENGETKAEKKEENGTVEEKKSDKPVERKDENGVLKTSGRILEGRNNSKYDASKLPESDDPTKIRAQVEFYFGDSNLPTDKFLWEKTDGSSNLPVDVDIICKFGRMKRFKSRDVILAALKESKFLQVTGEEGKEQVNRRVAYDPTFTKSSKVEARSIYVKGFGDEEPSSQFDIEAFFAPYGPTNAVRLRRTPDKFFKGSVFVEFQDEETAKKFLELDPKPLWKGTLPLNIMSKKAYVDGKEQDIKDGKLDPQEARTPYQRGGRGRGRGGRGGNFKGGDRERNGNRDRGDRDPDDWKKRREDDRASGFKDDRRNGRDGHHKKGGRGGRGGRRDDRGGRGGDRNREREDRDKDSKAEAKTEESNEKKAEPAAETNPNEKKRAREDDGEGAPAKKIDTKTEVSVES
ncbi:related to RNA-binding protein La1 [Phialocephala subalpina]|uniref:Related to RNA-binding protein La1 n=1 Tax=Phialocephala subalpina TaxID=576137 RepID=A0A1L7XP36_9HELO|nr:related to RNA-binding protein La1 [Phialocephala subalpina]